MLKKFIDIFLRRMVASDTQVEQAEQLSRQHYAAKLSAAWEQYFFD